MSFEVYTPVRGLSLRSIQPHQASIAKSGVLALNVADLKAAQITDKAVILIDPKTRRIALRRARDGELDTMAVTVYGRPKGTTRRITAFKGVLLALGIDPAQAAGRYELTAHDDLLVLNLADAAKRQKAKRK